MHESKWPFLLAHGPGMVVIDCWDRFCTLGRAPRTKKTLPSFCEWCQVTRHPRVFRRLTGYQQTPGNWGVTISCRHSSRDLHVLLECVWLPLHVHLGGE